MPLLLTEEQTILRDSVRGFLADHGPVAHLRQLRDTRDAAGFSRDLWAQFAEMGFTGVLVPESFGGSGLGHVEAGLVMEEIGRNLTPSPFLATALLAASAIARAGSADQKSAYLPKIAAGKLLAALAADEGPKHRPHAIEMTAKRKGNGFVLDGAKAMVIDGHVDERTEMHWQRDNQADRTDQRRPRVHRSLRDGNTSRTRGNDCCGDANCPDY